MIPKYRAWDMTDEVMSEILDIDFVAKVVQLKNENMSSYFKPFSEIVFSQSTGLKDKNGQEIFEGDIVVNHVGDEWVITNFRGAFRYYSIENFSKEKEIWFETDNIGNFGTEVFEIIGNIYENPELLEAE